MTTSPGLQGLIERLEKCTGPSVAMDREIAEGIGLNVHFDTFREQPMYSITFSHGAVAWFSLPPYTGSIDAALMLVPEGFGCDFVRPAKGATGRPRATVFYLDFLACAEAATPSIALCIAAIRARAATPTEAQ